MQSSLPKQTSSLNKLKADPKRQIDLRIRILTDLSLKKKRSKDWKRILLLACLVLFGTPVAYAAISPDRTISFVKSLKARFTFRNQGHSAVKRKPTPKEFASSDLSHSKPVTRFESETIVRGKEPLPTAIAIKTAPTTRFSNTPAYAGATPREKEAYQHAHAVHFKQKDFPAAIASWKHFLNRHSQSALTPEARYNLAIAQLKLNQKAEAIENLKTCLNNNALL